MSVSGGWSGLPAQPRKPLNVRPRIVSAGRKEKWRMAASCSPIAGRATRYRFLYPSGVEVEPNPGTCTGMPRSTASVPRVPGVSSRPRIGDLGLIGDTRTAALVDTRGSVVWLCLPHFDGEPVFAALVAGRNGGLFTLGPASDANVVRRRYLNSSTVLETTWQVGDAHVVLTEGMVADVQDVLFPTFCLVRRLEARGAEVT